MNNHLELGFEFKSNISRYNITCTTQFIDEEIAFHYKSSSSWIGSEGKVTLLAHGCVSPEPKKV